jgi:hypothetical protein
MAERGKARYSLISVGSNTTVKSTPGTLYAVHVYPANGATVRIEDGELGATIDFNAAAGSSTIDLQSGYASAAPAFIGYGPGIGFEKLTLAATSNARLAVFWE